MPAPPAGFEPQLACEDLTGDDISDCFIDCAGGLACPKDMLCIADTICMFGAPPGDIPPYGDCANEAGECQGGSCVPGPESAVCGQACMDVTDCAPPPASGDAPVLCTDATGDGQNECVLDCSAGAECPTGMWCIAGGICAWPAG